MRLRGVFVRSKAVEFDAELESHIAMDADDAIRAGLSNEEARRQAMLRLGGAEQTRQAYRDRATLPPLESLSAGCALCHAPDAHGHRASPSPRC